MEIWKLEPQIYRIVEPGLQFIIAVVGREQADDGFVSYITVWPETYAEAILKLSVKAKPSNELEILIELGITKEGLETLISSYIEDNHEELMRRRYFVYEHWRTI